MLLERRNINVQTELKADELVQKLGKVANDITRNSRETTHWFQQLPVALKRGTNAVSFQNAFTAG